MLQQHSEVARTLLGIMRLQLWCAKVSSSYNPLKTQTPGWSDKSEDRAAVAPTITTSVTSVHHWAFTGSSGAEKDFHFLYPQNTHWLSTYWAPSWFNVCDSNLSGTEAAKAFRDWFCCSYNIILTQWCELAQISHSKKMYISLKKLTFYLFLSRQKK